MFNVKTWQKPPLCPPSPLPSSPNNESVIPKKGKETMKKKKEKRCHRREMKNQ